MGVYGGIQLPNINEENLDNKKERKQILNYLALLDEKLRYMFQNIDFEDNFSDDAKEMVFKYGEDLRNVIKDSEGNFSMLEQTIDGIRTIVANNRGDISMLEQRADLLAVRMSNAEGEVAMLDATADSILSRLMNTEGDVSTLQQTAAGIKSTVRGIESDIGAVSSEIRQTKNKINLIVTGTGSSSLELTDKMISMITKEFRLYGEMKMFSGSVGTAYGGYLSYGTGNNGAGRTTGVILSSKDKESYVIATNSGVRMTYGDICAVYCINGAVCQTAGEFGTRLDDASGNFCPTVDDDQLLGKSTRLWQGLYAGNATIQTSDRRKKNSIEYDMEKYEDFFRRLKPTQYKLNNGDSGRYHVGFISQDVEEAMAEAGLDSLDFAGFIKTPVHEKELPNGDYDETTPIIDHKYALRYGEFVALNTHMIQKLMARVTELENKLEALS